MNNRGERKDMGGHTATPAKYDREVVVHELTPYSPHPRVKVTLPTDERGVEFASVLFHSARMMKPGGGVEEGHVKKVTLHRVSGSDLPDPTLTINLHDTVLPSVRLSEFLKKNMITDKQFEVIDSVLTKTPELIQPDVFVKGR